MSKYLVTMALLAVAMLAIPAQRAEARTITQVLASVPDTIFHVVTIGTDTAEYVSGKVAQGFAKVDVVADDAVLYFHNVAHPTPTPTAAQVAKAQAKLAKKSAKKAK